MSTYSLVQLVVNVVIGAALVSLALLVYRRNRDSATNRIYATLSVATFLWLIAIYVSSLPQYDYIYLELSRLTILFAPVQAAFFFLLAKNLPETNLQLKKSWFYTILFLMFLVMILTQTPFVFSDVQIESGNAQLIIGPVMPVFVLFVSGFSIAAVVTLILKIRKEKGIRKKQLQFMLSGILLMLLLIILTIMVPVIFFKSDIFLPFAPVYVFSFLGATAYAIVRYRLMDIRTVISRSIVYAVLVSLVTAGFTLSTYLGSLYLSQESQVAQIGILAVASLLIVILIDPIKRGLARVTNKVFFKAAIDYPEVTKSLTDIINEEIHLDKLVTRFSEELASQLRLQDTTILLPVGEDAFLAPEELQSKRKPRKKKNNSVFFNSPFIKYLKKQKRITILDELDHKVAEASTTRERNTYDRVRKNFEEIDCYAAIPVIASDQIEAILILSRKLSGETFSTNDIQLLEVIAPQVASGIQKARLYQESQEFNTKLQREVERATKKLREANGKLQELDKAKSEFMSIASHQLRTPLAGIIGYLSMIEEGDYGEVQEEQQQVIHDIREGSQRLARLVNIFLNVTRIEAGRFVMNFTKVPFHTVIEDMYKELKPTADKKNVKLTYKKKKLPEVEVDVDKIKDVVLNLTDNAIKYTPEGSVTVSAEANKRTVHVMVTDTGVGIDPKEAENLFSKFVRGSDIANVQPNGSGLGLFIAKKIVEGHGGRIWAESEGKEKGSTFHFEIPIKADKDAKERTEEFKAQAKQ